MAGFHDIIGHDMVKDHLQKAIEYHKVSHAYILSGEEGMGRKTIISGGLRSIMKINRLYSTGVPLYPACFMISMWEKPDSRLRTALFSGR